VRFEEFRAFVEDTGYKTEAEQTSTSTEVRRGCHVWNAAIANFEPRPDYDWTNPGFAQSPASPVVCVSWNDARAYAHWLSLRTGQEYRLPTAAEWEYATRAGTKTPFWTGDCIHTDQANYDGNSDYNGCGADTGVFRGLTVPVGSLPANPWGLHEVAGNVWEWTQDCWHPDGYAGAPNDGSAWGAAGGGDCTMRVIRGSGWLGDARVLRSANLDSSRGTDVSLGFRLARTL
jgi:formylglycine-generating enzyme required for sulfatase activity